MISATILANNILQRAFTEKIPVTPMKLQKLLYLVYKQYLRDTNLKLFQEDIQAWRYGPVVQSVYDEFKSFRAQPITKFAKDSQGNAYIADESSDEDLKVALDSVWRTYRGFDGITLSTMTHQPGTAWDKAIKNQSGVLNCEDIQQERPLIEFLSRG